MTGPMKLALAAAGAVGFYFLVLRKKEKTQTVTASNGVTVTVGEPVDDPTISMPRTGPTVEVDVNDDMRRQTKPCEVQTLSVWPPVGTSELDLGDGYTALVPMGRRLDAPDLTINLHPGEEVFASMDTSTPPGAVVLVRLPSATASLAPLRDYLVANRARLNSAAALAQQGDRQTYNAILESEVRPIIASLPQYQPPEGFAPLAQATPDKLSLGVPYWQIEGVSQGYFMSANDLYDYLCSRLALA